MWTTDNNVWNYFVEDIKTGFIRKINEQYYAFYKDMILSNYSTLEAAKVMVENPTLNYTPKIDEKYIVRP